MAWSFRTVRGSTVERGLQILEAPIKDAAWREMHGKTLDDDMPCAVLSSGQYAAPGRNRVANIVSALSEEVDSAPLLDPRSGTPNQPPSPGPQCSDWPAIAQRLRSDCGALRPPLPSPVPCACPLPLAHCRVCAVRVHGALCAPPD